MERLERLDGTGWSLRYDAGGCPPGTDSLLLAGFPRLKPGVRICDLGSGSGLLALLLLRREPSAHVTCVEIQPAFCALAEQNRAENGLEDRMAVRCADLRDTAALPPAGSFDLVISNPPYFPAGTGASAPSPLRRSVREETSCTLEEVCRAAARLLRWGGTFCLVHRPERLADLCVCLRSEALEPKRLRLVQPGDRQAPSLVLLEGRLGGGRGVRVEPPLILRPSDTPSGAAQTAGEHDRRKEAP